MREARSTMQRLRSTWVALVGGAFLLAVSVSAAFGAPPTDEDGPRGRSVSGFVHELIFGSEANAGDAVVDEDEENQENEEEDSEESDERSDQGSEVDADEETKSEDNNRQTPEEFANHGECVSQAAHDQEAFEASDAENRGAWVSTHARYTCWGLEPPDDAAEEADADESDEEADAESTSDKEERKAAKEAAKTERNASKEAAKDERTAAKAERKGGRGD
jgi:hypothetical protein